MKKQRLLNSKQLMWIVVLSCLLFLLCLSPVIADNFQWNNTTLMAGRTFGLSARGLCADHQGNLHLTYGESALVYNFFDGPTLDDQED